MQVTVHSDMQESAHDGVLAMNGIAKNNKVDLPREVAKWFTKNYKIDVEEKILIMCNETLIVSSSMPGINRKFTIDSDSGAFVFEATIEG